MEKYQKKWKPVQDLTFKTIELNKFEAILDEFGCDKSFIRLHMDTMLDHIWKREAIEDGVTLSTFANDSAMVSDIPNSLRYLFAGVVTKVNWKVEKCRRHDYCLNNLKKEILKAMRSIVNLGEGTYIALGYLMTLYKELEKNCEQTYGPELVPDHRFRHVPYTSTLIPEAYTRVTDYYKLPVYPNFLAAGQGKPAWMLRFLVDLGWIENFFTPGKSDGIRDLIASTMLPQVPIEAREQAKEFMRGVLNCAQSSNANQSEKKPGDASKS